MTAGTALLAAELADELADVEHHRGSLQVVVGGAALSADSPRDLRQVLSGHLYNHWHTRLGADEDTGARFYRDLGFEAELAAHTPPKTTRRAAELLPGAAGSSATEVVVALDGVRVVVPASSVGDERGSTVTVVVPAARPSLSPGFWLVDGSHGRFPADRPPVRVYLSIAEMAAAPAVWRTALTALEAGGHRYRAKVGSAQRLYPRTDAAVIYLGADALAAYDADGSGPIGALRAAVHAHPGIGRRTSAFTRTIAPGIAVATEPADPRPGMAGMSFGQHRCYAVATGILDTTDDADLAVRVHRALTAAAADPREPARNLTFPAPAGQTPESLDGKDQ